MIIVVNILAVFVTTDSTKHSITSLRRWRFRDPKFSTFDFQIWIPGVSNWKFFSRSVFHECVLSSMSSGFTVALVIQQIFACTKIVRILSSHMATFTSFVGTPNTWLVEPVGYGVRCRDNCLNFLIDIPTQIQQ